MIETSLYRFDVDVCCFHSFHDFGSDFLTSDVRERFLVVLGREPIEAMGHVSCVRNTLSTGLLLVYQIGHLRCVGLDLTCSFRLPMRRKHDDCSWLDFGGNLLADFLQFLVGGMIGIIHDVGLRIQVSKLGQREELVPC